MSRYRVNIAKSNTDIGVGLPYTVVAQLLPESDAEELDNSNDVIKLFRTDLSRSYAQKDISCHIDNYTRIATIRFRNEKDCADFLMRY
tara:strand:+ start:591 stop:854 length:264 start_codon:yes stop_codon:yes gene_type:complete